MLAALLLLFPTTSVAVPNEAATQEEDSFMFGRIAAAMEDAAGGYTKEALRRFTSINRDLGKREYPARTRWLAHHWYGKALLDSGDLKSAPAMLETAKSDAVSLGEADRGKTEELIRQTQKKLSARNLTRK